MISITSIFIVLKLFKVIDWDWLWVFCPLWLPILFFLINLALYALGIMSLITIYMFV